MWAGHDWRKQGYLVKQVIKEDPIRKRSLGKPGFRCANYVKKCNHQPNGKSYRKIGRVGNRFSI